MPLRNAPSSCAVTRAALRPLPERHRISAFFQPLGPYREPVAIPVEDFHPVAPPVGEHEQMPGERIELDLTDYQRMQSIETAPHITG